MKSLYYKFRAFVVTWLLRLLPRPAPVLFSGIGSANTLAEQLAILGHNKVLIVTDSFLGGSGILDGIKAVLDKNGTAYAIFDGVLPDPAFDQIQAGEATLRTENCDAVLAVGGGSVLDAGKLISLLHTNPGKLEDFDGIQKAKNVGVPLFVVPTTAGTGSEITYVSVISDPDTHKKVPVIDSKLMPGYVALDADIMKGMPPGITAATGMDALTHAVESYVATSSTPATEVQATAAVKLIFKYLTRAWHQGDDLEARDAMALAAFYAGSAFGRTSVGYVHGIAHQLGRVCHTPHGNANAMVLPEVLANYGACVHERLAQLARIVGIGAPGDDDAALAQQFIQAIVDMRVEMELPLKPKGLTQGDVPDIVEEAIAEAGSLYPVPRYMSEAEITGIVRGLLEAA
ncbi:alcohol dehydrogenase [Halioglobus japonicus]|uniref:Alcohol dehydrogenase n=1 Tax=Halioglobus japonicus TaxID=930805 RepID=A0AAP8MHK1_9GAMM|nr:iron-containing alcohol dehydrogenase [Halioglobus japonicus]PLW87514.1 alcohol dehydrogenase [Halioglobus japonicus]GHD08074.1 alcohol dehydrogenase [Halioglobus japonicus]